MGGKSKAGALVLFGGAAFAAGWIKGHVSGIRQALGLVERLRRYAECRSNEDGCEWVYPPGHPREGEPFGDYPKDGLRFVEREARCYRPFTGLPLLETIEFDAAKTLPRRRVPPDLPPWWEWGTSGPGLGEYRERKRREDERVRYQRELLRHLRRRLFGGLRMVARSRRKHLADSDRSRRSVTLALEVENTALVPLEAKELHLTYVYQNPLVERIFGHTTPRRPLPGLDAQDGSPPKIVAAGENVRYAVTMREVRGVLVGVGLDTWPDTRLMRLEDPVSVRLAARGGPSLRLVNLLRKLTFWRLAVGLVDGRGGRLKAEVREVPPWEEQ